MQRIVIVLGALVLAVPARADTAPVSPSAAAVASAAATSAGASSAAHSDEDDPGVGKDEKPEHREKRRAYIRRTKKSLGEAVHAHGKTLTDDERSVIRKHWRVSMRLWRIRHVAELDGNKAAVAQVDTLLAKADARVLAQLKELNAKAPAAATSGTKGAK